MPEPPGGLLPVETGHPAVHQDQLVVVARGQALEGLLAVDGDVDLAAQALQQAGRDQLVDRVVLDEQHPHRVVDVLAVPGRDEVHPTERAQHGAAQVVAAHRLVEHRGPPAAHRLGGLVGCGVVEQHQRGTPRTRAARECVRVRSQQRPVDQHEVVGRARRLGVKQGERGRLDVTHAEDGRAPGAELDLQGPQRRLVVVRDQHPVAVEHLVVGERLGGRCPGRGRGRGAPQRHREPERAAAARSAGGADLAAERGHQPARDRQSETGAAVAAGRGGVGLGEGLEEGVHRVRIQPHAGVGDLHAQQAGVRRLAPGVHHHLTGVGELHGVRDQVGQHLAQPQRVADAVAGQVRLAERDELEPLLTGGPGEDADGLLDDRGHLEGLGVDLEPARLDLGQVEDVVDDREQGVAGPAQRLGQGPLALVEATAQEQLGQADHPVHRGADLVTHRREELRLQP